MDARTAVAARLHTRHQLEGLHQIGLTQQAGHLLEDVHGRLQDAQLIEVEPLALGRDHDILQLTRRTQLQAKRRIPLQLYAEAVGRVA